MKSKVPLLIALIGLIIAGPSLGNSEAILSQAHRQLVGSWRFDEGTGSTAFDSSENGNHGATYIREHELSGSNIYYRRGSQNASAGNRPPVADFTWQPQEPEVGETVYFTDQSHDPDGSIVSWMWMLGDGATTQSQNPTHVYKAPGTYLIVLQVTDDDGATNIASKQISVKKIVQPAPSDECAESTFVRGTVTAPPVIEGPSGHSYFFMKVAEVLHDLTGMVLVNELIQVRVTTSASEMLSEIAPGDYVEVCASLDAEAHHLLCSYYDCVQKVVPSLETDLAISDEDISFSESRPIRITAKVHNIGANDARAVKVQFLLSACAREVIACAPSRVIGEQIINFIPKGGTGIARASVTSVEGYPIEVSAGDSVTVVVDPSNIIPETNEENNEAYKKLSPREKVDAEFVTDGWPDSCQVSSGTYKPGDKIRADCRVKNIGKAQAQFVLVFKIRAPDGRTYRVTSDRETILPGRRHTYKADQDDLVLKIPNDSPAGPYDVRLEVKGYDTKQVYDVWPSVGWKEDQFTVGTGGASGELCVRASNRLGDVLFSPPVDIRVDPLPSGGEGTIGGEKEWCGTYLEGTTVELQALDVQLTWQGTQYHFGFWSVDDQIRSPGQRATSVTISAIDTRFAWANYYIPRNGERVELIAEVTQFRGRGLGGELSYTVRVEDASKGSVSRNQTIDVNIGAQTCPDGDTTATVDRDARVGDFVKVQGLKTDSSISVVCRPDKFTIIIAPTDEEIAKKFMPTFWQLQCDIDNGFLFSVQDGQRIGQIVQALNAGTIPSALRDAFSANGITLSAQASVEVVTPNAEWRITDQGRVFIIRLEAGTLNIYDNGNSVREVDYHVVRDRNKARIEYNVIFNDEDHPDSVWDSIYDEWRKHWYGGIRDIETIYLTISLEDNTIKELEFHYPYFASCPEASSGRGTWYGGQEYNSWIPDHYCRSFRGDEVATTFTFTDGHIDIFVATWNHLYSDSGAKNPPANCDRWRDFTHNNTKLVNRSREALGAPSLVSGAIVNAINEIISISKAKVATEIIKAIGGHLMNHPGKFVKIIGKAAKGIGKVYGMLGIPVWVIERAGLGSGGGCEDIAVGIKVWDISLNSPAVGSRVKAYSFDERPQWEEKITDSNGEVVFEKRGLGEVGRQINKLEIKYQGFQQKVEIEKPRCENYIIIGVNPLLSSASVEISIYSPVDLAVTDPDGLVIDKQSSQIPGATYTEKDLNGDGDPDDQIIIPDRKLGNYSIEVIPEPRAAPTDTYTLEVSAGGETTVLAKNEQISDIPDQPYEIASTDEGISLMTSPVPSAHSRGIGIGAIIVIIVGVLAVGVVAFFLRSRIFARWL